jgi:hypothetical protein
LVLLGLGQQKHFTGRVRVVVQFARCQRVVVVGVLFVDFDAASWIERKTVKKQFKKSIEDKDSPLALVRCWRPEHVPKRLGTHLTGGGHVIAQLEEFVT